MPQTRKSIQTANLRHADMTIWFMICHFLSVILWTEPLSVNIFEIFASKYIRDMIWTFRVMWRHRLWQFDSPCTICYWWSSGNGPLSPTIFSRNKFMNERTNKHDGSEYLLTEVIKKQAVVRKHNKPHPHVAHRGIARFLGIYQKCNQVVPWSLHTFPENFMQIGPAVFS